MNGAHDMGGMHGFGAINAEPEAQEPVFHAEWERRVFALVRSLGLMDAWSLDMSRQARERQLPVDYLQHTYYENWLAGLEKLLIEKAIVSPAELATGKAAGLADERLRQARLEAADISRAVTPAITTLPIASPPRFQVGAAVRVHNNHPAGHTRSPRYVRGRTGVIHSQHGGHIFPDESARGTRVARHLYTVRFEARELWGADADVHSAVYVDLWEDYLEAA
jgi:nitrile hydratase subunit beta